MEAHVERRLAAILAADVVGFSRMIGADEEGTLATLKALRRDIVDPSIASHRGRIFKTTGDGVLVEFASAIDAVRCALEIQRATAEQGAAVPEHRRIVLRIGINVGDVIADEGDVFGDGVNIAARVEAAATPGLVCLSDNAYQQIKGTLLLDVADLGEKQLKNIAAPVRIFELRLEGVSAGKAGSTKPSPSSQKPSIAVLPFANMSGDPDQEYFADGMVEEIITGLSRIKWFSVISRNSSFIYKNKPVAATEAADKLGARYVLEGGVRKAGNRVRITAQLVDAASGVHLWAEKYDRLLTDVFALQDEITLCVVGAIEPNLRKAEVDRVRRQRPGNLSAYDLVLRSLPFVYASMPKNAELAMPLLEEALKLDPDYGAAHAFKSLSLVVRITRGQPRDQDREAAIRHARTAIACGGDDATTIAIAAFVVAMIEHDAAAALKLFDRALELSNSNVFALNFGAQACAWIGKTELAIERAHYGLRLSPFDSLNYRSYQALAICYFQTHRYDEAAEAARCVVQSNPDFSIGHALLAAALIRLGRPDEARASARAVIGCQPSFSVVGLARAVEFDPTVFGPLADAWREAGLP
jgi:adenylate cyclase